MKKPKSIAKPKAPKRPRKTVYDALYPGHSERSDRGKANRAKGVRYERDVANAFLAIFPRARRLYGQAREGNACPDVGGTPFWLEVGRGTTTAIHEKIEQGLSDSSSCPNPEYQGMPVLAATKTASGRDLVTMERGQFLELLRRVAGAAEDGGYDERAFEKALRG